MAKYLTSGSILMLALASPAVAAPSPMFEKPRLVLQITVDQLRGDLPMRYFDRLGEGGLRYLLEEGIHYNNASPDEWDKAPGVARIKNKFGIEGPLIQGYDHPYLYLTTDITRNPWIDLAALETLIAKELVAFPGVSYVIPSTSLELGTVPDNLLTRGIAGGAGAIALSIAKKVVEQNSY